MVTPTLFDLAAIAGLRPDGCSVNAAMDVDISLFNDDIKDSRDYTAFFKKFNAKDGPVQFKEHVAFLWYWICRFIACSPARVIVRQYLGLAVCLAQGRKLALGQFVLGELYRAISDVILHLNSEDKRYEFANAGGPIWIYQIWLYAYFPELVHLDELLLPPSPPNYGTRLLYCLPKWGKLNNDDFVENFSFFYNLKDRPDEYYAPFAKRIFGPSWFKFGILDWSNHTTIWCKFLCSAGLHVGLTFSGRYKHTHSGVEYYFPNCVARQFGLNQGVPFLLLYWFCHEYRVPFKSLDDIKRVEEVNAMIHEQYSHKALTPSSCTTNEFDLWWMDYVKSTFRSHISDLKDQLLFTSQSQLPMKSIRLCDVGVLKTSSKSKKLPLAKIVKRARCKSFTLSEKRQPAKKKARQYSPTPSVCKRIAPSKGDTSNDLVLLTRKELIPHSISNQGETDRNYICLMDPNENSSSSLHNKAGGSPDIDSILRSIEVEPDEEGLLAFVNSLSQTTNERASVESVATSSEIKASLEELDLILSKEFTTVCQETTLFERLKELIQFLISQEGHDFIGRGMISALQDINQQIDRMQFTCISACNRITKIAEKQEEENMNEQDLLRIKQLLEDMEVKLHAAEERRNELTACKLEYENKLRELEEGLRKSVEEKARLSCIKRKAQERAVKLTPKFSKFRKEKLAVEKEKAAARQICNDLNLKWLNIGIALQN
ncbi:serine/threonine-protein phosphatase 7 long form-like protein [Rhynchospora pubera]|uniref:Serine/threonine-protein phosphatase 7 long form-like protein n=1 Tax=Rhynchospora pubera TaxID=906938 RepID=A0AAV8C0S1_9POAL|nr:serine/threonine-protein phosphatase 7 long form-like protein [Rhynchospora pubera]